ncbi:MAG: ATP-dependent DNA ligase [Candidatus Pacearchaeota archaeon]|nr:ATP-dependent DNA ligase [Candidatus Pacearchaeota archaeon]
MEYREFVEVYENLGKTTKRLEKVDILAEFLERIKKKGEKEWVYLLSGRVFPNYEPREFGISRQLAIKAIAFSFGINEADVIKRFKKIGDLGEIAEEFALRKKQMPLVKGKLSVGKVFDNLRKITEIEGKGAVDRKLDLVKELLGYASGREAKYIVRTLLSDLRIGVADGVLRDAIAKAFLKNEERASEKIEEAYDLAVDWAIVFDAASKGVKELEEIEIVPGKPMNVMLAIKAKDIAEGFEICGGGKVGIEIKYDGFRMLINKTKDGEISLFTRRLENVTRQFPDVVDVVKRHVKGESFILDSEVVGYDAKTKKYKPFEAISQRIKRKYEIEELEKKLPVEVNIFDILYYNGKSVMKESFRERRKIVEKIVDSVEFKIKVAEQIVTDREEEAMKFYDRALKVGEEGIMIKNLNAEYKPGRRVGYMAKLKPETKDFDLVIVGAEYGTGKRGGLLTSYILACDDEGRLVEVGKVSSGLKEKESEGMTFEEMTKLLKPLIIEEKGNVVKVKPKIVVSVTYQNIQKSPSYSSGYALRFPRITRYRPDKSIEEITSLDEVEREAKKERK